MRTAKANRTPYAHLQELNGYKKTDSENVDTVTAWCDYAVSSGIGVAHKSD